MSVDWSVDSAMSMPNGGPSFSTANLPHGMHTVTARVHDNAGMELVRYRTGGNTFDRQWWGQPTHASMMRGSERTVTWTVTVQ